MSVTVQASFTTGELDPALHERTTFEKYQSGLVTARNVIIGKTGRLLSRAGRYHFKKAKLNNRKIIIHAMSHAGSFLEWGHLYVRVYSLDGTLIGDYSHAFTESNLDNIKFVDVDSFYVLIFLNAQNPLRLGIFSGGGFDTGFFKVPPKPNTPVGTNTGSPAGYATDYICTTVINGEESEALVIGTGNLPIANGQSVILSAITDGADTPNAIDDDLQEMRFYRRPASAGAYGFIGSTTFFTAAATVNRKGTFTDVGQDADYTNGPPTLNTTIRDRSISGPLALKSFTATIYQQRLCLSYQDRIETSRTGFPYNFFRDYPLNAASSLSIKSGSGGYPFILSMIDSDGLVVFTSEGVFLHRGEFSPTNLALEKKGNWVIDELIPPIAIPGGVLFIDKKTNTVRQLNFSQEFEAYVGDELSIFSDHLFSSNKIKSWAFQEGEFPLLWVTFTDGSYASFTYIREHNMRAWTRHDSGKDVDYVATTNIGISQVTGLFVNGDTIFVTNVSGQRYIELAVPRRVTVADLAADSEADKWRSIAAIDAMVSYKTLINDDIVDDTITVTPVAAGVWDGDLTLAVTDDAIFPDPGAGTVGAVIRYFDPADRTSIDLTVTARASDNSITVTPSATFPSANATDPRLYLTATVYTGLDHLEGEKVSIVADGYVLASPNNNIINYTTVTVSSGSITLPDSYKGAIVHIGRPYVMDVETLDIDTVEQRPVLIESQTVDKVYVKVFNSRGLYVNYRFPDSDLLTGMDVSGVHEMTFADVDGFDVNYEEDNPVTGNRYAQPRTKRLEIILPGDWKSQGRIALRQVDPVHFEILSIIPDIDDLKRGR